jgi:spoIIIJ-associated protein
MDVLEVNGKTVEEATEKALAQLGATREEVRITVVSEGKAGGLFGIGAEDAVVKVERITPGAAKPATETPASAEPAASTDEIARVAAEALQKLVDLMEIQGKVVPGEYPAEDVQGNTAPLAFNVEGDDLGILIGRRGQTLAALQYLLRLIVSHQTNTWMPIVVDAEGYKARRHDALKALALRMADHVKSRGAPFTLEPMPAYERRIIHLALADNAFVFTESAGEGESRKVVIKPKSPGQRNGAKQPDNTGSMRGPAGRSYGQRTGFIRRPQY